MPNTSCTIVTPASLRSDCCSPSFRNAVRLPSGIDVHLHRNAHIDRVLNESKQFCYRRVRKLRIPNAGMEIKKANLYGASTGAALVRFSNAAAVNVTRYTNGPRGDVAAERQHWGRSPRRGLPASVVESLFWGITSGLPVSQRSSSNLRGDGNRRRMKSLLRAAD